MNQNKGSPAKGPKASGKLSGKQSKRLRMSRHDKRQMAGLVVLVFATAFIGMWTALIKNVASKEGVLSSVNRESLAIALSESRSVVEMSYSEDTEFRDDDHKISASSIPIGASITVSFTRSLFTLDHAQMVVWHRENSSHMQVSSL